MTLNEYQHATRQYAKYPRKTFNQALCYTSIALAGEAGETCNEVKKYLRRDGVTPTFEEHHNIMLELGDTLWYIAAVAYELGIALEDVAQTNLVKLEARHGK